MNAFLMSFQGKGIRQAILTMALLATAVTPVRLHAQGAAGEPRATRTALAERVATLEKQLAATKSSSEQRRLRAEIESTNNRLRDGDFQVGDQMAITIVWDSTSADTASVREGLVVAVRHVPDFSLKGVLRSELSERLNAHISRYLRNALVRTNVLTRISVTGAVVRPGFYSISPDRPISEMLMLAGGPTPLTKLNEIEVKRGGRTILNKSAAKNALLEGRTLEQLDIRSGDEIKVPEKRKISWQQITQLLFIASSLFFAFLQFIQWYYREN